MGKILGFGSHGWTHRHTWQGVGNDVTGIAVDMQPIPPATLQMLDTRLALCVTKSDEWILLVELLPFDRVENLFVKYFRCESLSNQDRRTKHALAMAKLRATRAGIKGRQEVKFQPMTGKDGYVGGGTFHGEEKYRIHLNTATFAGGAPGYCVEVYLHEATHKYARTNDHVYLRPDYFAQDQPYLNNIDMAAALDNADSYAGFAREVTLRENQAVFGAQAQAAAAAAPAGAAS